MLAGNRFEIAQYFPKLRLKQVRQVIKVAIKDVKNDKHEIYAGKARLFRF